MTKVATRTTGLAEVGSGSLAAERVGSCLVVAISVLSIGATLVQTPGVKSDPGWGILAAHQYLLGKSPNLHTLTLANPEDLRRDRADWISWWPPSYQAVPFAFHELGMEWGDAIKATVLLAWLVGAVAWSVYFRIAAGPHAWQPWLIFAFLCFRYSHDQAYNYNGGDRLLLSSFPVALLLNLWAAAGQRRCAVLFAGAVGASSSVLFLVKYSGALSVVGFGCAWLWGALRGRISWSRGIAWAVGAAAVAVLLHLLGFPGGRTAASLGGPDDDVWRVLGWSLWSWPLAISDLESLVAWVFMHPGRERITPDSAHWFGLGLMCLVGVTWLLRGRSPVSADEETREIGKLCRVFAMAHLGAVCVLLFLIDSFGGHYLRYHAWYFQIAAVPILPWLFALCYEAARGTNRLARVAGVASLAIFFVVPALYGTAVLTEKAFHRNSRSKALVSREKIRLDLLGEGADAEAAYEEIAAITGGQGTVFYLTAPDLAFRLAHERLIVVHADFVAADALKSTSYKGLPPGGVALLLPRHFEDNGKRAIIQQSFRDVAQWQHRELRHAPQWLLWTSGSPVRGSILPANSHGSSAAR